LSKEKTGTVAGSVCRQTPHRPIGFRSLRADSYSYPIWKPKYSGFSSNCSPRGRQLKSQLSVLRYSILTLSSVWTGTVAGFF